MQKLMSTLVAATRQMEKRTKSLEQELQKSSTQVHELRSTLDNVRKETLIDPLTRIGNRKAFDAAISSAEKQAEGGEPISLLICDIDHFKKFNDTWGHQTGDQVLQGRGGLPVREHQGPRLGRPLWRRGIRPGAARRDLGGRHPGGRADPPIGGRPLAW